MHRDIHENRYFAKYHCEGGPMTEQTFFYLVLYLFIGLSAVAFVALIFMAAPYGRYARVGFGPRVNATLGWVLMEAPAPLLFAVYFIFGPRPIEPILWVFLILWELHYIHRAFVFPFRRRGKAQTMPLVIMLLGFLFNCINSYTNGRYLTALGGPYSNSWFSDPRFILGVILFLGGMAINQHSDLILFRLRKPGDTGYHIPRGGLYQFISAPNYFGEILEWFGYALLTWSPAALVFAIWTVANLLPRAIAHHHWYREKFPDYPSDRKAIIPFLL
jgi:3-oxo-5-alpha-steroid 4-dehydrogenase 1